MGIVPLFGASILRSFVDTMGYTQLTMRLFLLTMPVNCFMNYLFIFGKLGLPRMGGAGAGVGTAITCWLLFLSFSFWLRIWASFVVSASLIVQVFPSVTCGSTARGDSHGCCNLP